MQVKDINKTSVLLRIREIEVAGQSATWFQGFNNSLGPSMPEGAPLKLQLAVMKSLVSKGLVDGCCCGCRGDFVLTKKGHDLLNSAEETEGIGAD